MPLSYSQHFSAWRALQMSMWVRPWDLGFARNVQLSVKMSAAVSRSMSQFINFEVSCPSNMGMYWSKVVVRFDSLCVACKVSMYACIVVCKGSLGRGSLMWLECHSEVLQSICKLCQLLHMCGWVGGRFKVGKLVLKLPELIL